MIENKTHRQTSKCYCTKIRQASKALTQYYIETMQPSGLKITQFALLSHIKRLGPLTMNELSDAMNLERTTLVRNLKPLEKKKLIRILSQKNSKAYLIQLTHEGEKTLTKAMPYWHQAQASIEELLTKEEFEILEEILRKFMTIN